MKVYEAVFKNADTQGMYGLSLVSNPAMEDEWILLSEQPNEIKFAAVDQEKKLLLGAVLIPNKKILRKIDDNEFYITFSADTIEKIGHDFIRKGNQRNSQIEHKTKLDNVSVVESWIVQDSEKDKSAIYGKKYEVGTLVQMMKVDDETYNLAKDGTIKGFSIDALLGLQEIKLNTDMNTETKSITDAITDGFKSFFKAKEEKPKENKGAEVDINAFNVALSEALTEFKVEQDKAIEDLKVEFSKEAEDKDKEIDKLTNEIKDLKVELDKTPEVEPIKAKPEVEAPKVFRIGENRIKGTRDRVAEKMFS